MSSDEREKETFDFAFAGAGMAGLILARHLIEAFPGRTILLVDPMLDVHDPRTFAFWSDRPTVLDDLVEREYHTLLVHDTDARRHLELDAWGYRTFGAADFKRATLEALRANCGVTTIRGRVDDVVEGEALVELVVDGAPRRARWLFDSRLGPEDLRAPPERMMLRQRFEGWWIETDDAVFDPDAATVMDFRPEASDQIRFYYVLPASPRRALVECVVMGPSERPPHVEPYLREVLGLEDWRVLETESGSTPMTDRVAARRTGRHTMRVGIAGGRVRPSTGYALPRILRDSAAIEASLREYHHPFAIPGDRKLYRFLDSVMLVVMVVHASQMARIFGALFGRHPCERVLRFLDERASIFEVLAVIARLPWRFFIGPFLRWMAARLGFVRALPDPLRCR
jgi:lycopene beta-cyclase